MLGGPVVGYVLGNWLDAKFNTSPWLLSICLIFGLVASIRETIKLLGQLNRMADEPEDNDDL